VVKGVGVIPFLIFWDHGTLVPALGDVRVRQALNYALDRKTIGHAVLGPDAVPVSSLDAESDGDVPKYTDYYSYDPVKAKALLAAAGYPHGFTFKALALGPWAGSTYETDILCRALAKYWAAISVRMQCDAPSGAAWNQAWADRKTTYAAHLNQATIDPAWWFYQSYLSPGGPWADLHGVHDRAIDRLWQKGRRATGARARAIWRQVETQAILDAWGVPISMQPIYTFVSMKLVGVVAGTGAAGSGLSGVNDPTEWRPDHK
jgi:peptide/nickel transport system substrate-binding protein